MYYNNKLLPENCHPQIVMALLYICVLLSSVHLPHKDLVMKLSQRSLFQCFKGIYLSKQSPGITVRNLGKQKVEKSMEMIQTDSTHTSNQTKGKVKSTGYNWVWPQYSALFYWPLSLWWL